MFSLIVGWLTSKVSGILPYILIPLVVVVAFWGTYTYGHSKGYSEASTACRASGLQAELDAVNDELENLKKQVAESKEALATSQAQKQIIIEKATEAKQVITNEIKPNIMCDVDSKLIGLLNTVRTTNTSTGK